MGNKDTNNNNKIYMMTKQEANDFLEILNKKMNEYKRCENGVFIS